jgi:hypothetical protein
MEEAIIKYVMPGVLGLFGGIIGSLIVPWINWGVERRRTRQAKRRELIRSSRLLFTTETDKTAIRNTEVYAKLRPHLRQSVVAAVETESTEDGDRQPEDAFKEKLLEDIARIEKEWILI